MPQDEQENKPEKNDKTKDQPKETVKDSKRSKESLADIRAELDALRSEKQQWITQGQTLNDKVKSERDIKDKQEHDTRALESALTFNLTSSEFLKSNESLLPKEITEIFQAAEREKYDSALHKANATKAAIVQSFFSQQSNVELLTDSQKIVLSDYLKLTKNAKDDRAKEVYDNLFEPALGTLRRVKRAEELSRTKLGYRDSSRGDAQYKEKLMNGAKKHFLGEN